MEPYFYINMLRNIIVLFFQNGIWVLGFFYLLNKTFESKKLIQTSKVIVIFVLVFIFFDSVLRSL